MIFQIPTIPILNSAIPLDHLGPYGVAIYQFDLEPNADIAVEEEAITIFPCPSNNTINIHGITYYYSIKIYNASGVQVDQVQSLGDIKLNLNDYGSGLYFLELTNKSNELINVHKILKQ